jgi:hypothetical protein
VRHGRLAGTQQDLAAAQARIGTLEEEITRLRQRLADALRQRPRSAPGGRFGYDPYP